MINFFSITIVIFLFSIKLAVYFFIKNNDYYIFGGGNDSDYYDAYALGYENISLNLWPEILRLLHEFDIYSRNGVSFVLMIVSSLILPKYFGELVRYGKDANSTRAKFYLLIIIATYPQLFFLSLDIYRDVFMVFLYLIGIYFVKNIESKKFSLSIACDYFAAIIIGVILYEFRNYLGFAFLFSLFFSGFFSFSKINLKIFFFVFLIFMQILCYLGLLDSIFQYRYIFDDMDGGSNLNIRFDDKNLFVFYFLKNLLIQIFGFYFFNIKSILAFVSESFPFLLAMVYLIKNKQYADKFVNYLIVFFIAYSSIFIIGNDNLGSATRLRIFSYISIYVSCFIVYQKKNGNLNKSIDSKSIIEG